MEHGVARLILQQTVPIHLNFYMKPHQESVFGRTGKIISIRHQYQGKLYMMEAGKLLKTIRILPGRFLFFLPFVFLIIIIILYSEIKNYSSNIRNKGGE